MLCSGLLYSRYKTSTLHQTAVTTSANHERVIDEQAAKVVAIQERVENIAKTTGNMKDGFRKSLIEPKNVTVDVFHGSVADSRAKFLSWGERVRDKADLMDDQMSAAMLKAENLNEPITPEISQSLGVGPAQSRELQGFLKDRNDGTAHSIIRNNKSAVGLDSWRLLCKQFNPRTLQSTLNAQDLETKPRGASKIAEMPARLVEWEKALRRCTQEGRDQPSDEVKRLALFRMLPQKQRSELWINASKLYPTFTDLLAICARNDPRRA